MKSKYIHYCWFGDKPLPKLAKKCIKSWKKYLPDYEIIKWDESNVDFNECPFIKEAYENKKWAFVSDYARTKAIYNMGGIYFDTDMMVIKPIDFLLDKETFLGLEDSFMVNSAVWGANQPKTYFSKKMLDFYKLQKHFDINNMFKMSMPRVITRILNELDFDHTSNEIQYLKHNITIYPREYFYPLSFNFKDNLFTDNTCMVHYFDASWFTKKEKFLLSLKRKFGENKVNKVNNVYRKIRHLGGKIIYKSLYRPAKYFKYTYFNNGKYMNDINQGIKALKNLNNTYIVMHNPDWLGVSSATEELFRNNRVPCGEFFRKRDIYKFGKLILKQNITQVIFSAMCLGWKDLAYYLKKQNPKIKIKVFWHGNISQVSEPYGWARNIELIDMCKDGTIEVFGLCKKSLIPFYQNLGIKTCFIDNTVKLPNKINNTKSKDLVIGLYAAKSDDWRKNLFTQIAAISMLKDVTIDMIPLDYDAAEFASNLGINMTGLNKPLKREKLIERMSKNTLNLYVTFSECAPMLPLESMEVGTVCLTGNNHHYFKDTKLQDYLVVDNEENPIEIYNKINLCLKEKEKILKLYNNWKIEHDTKVQEQLKEFIEK